MMKCQRDKFSIEERTIYLNGAYMSPLLKTAEAKSIEGLQLKRDPTKIGMEHFFDATDKARELFAQLIGAPQSDSCVIIPSVSYGIANAASNIRFSPGQNIVLVDEGFPSNYYYWKRLATEHDLEIRSISRPADGNWNNTILNAIDEQTRVVSMCQVHWADGFVFDLLNISKAIHEHDGYLILDGTQSIGAYPFLIDDIQPDVLVVSSYKWMLGPLSLGMAYYNQRFNNGKPIEESWYNRLNSDDFQNLARYQSQYRDGARRYEVGQAPNFVLLPAMVEGMRQLIEWTPTAIQGYCKDMVGKAWKDLKNKGFRIDTEHCAAHLFGIRLPDGLNMESIKMKMKQNNIHVSYRGDAIRVSPSVYNTREEINGFVHLLSSMLRDV